MIKTTLAVESGPNQAIDLVRPRLESQSVFDFSDLPQNSISRQSVAVEQICLLFGLERRLSRRLAKGTFALLSVLTLDRLIENQILLEQTPSGWQLCFRFATAELGTLDGIRIDTAEARVESEQNKVPAKTVSPTAMLQRLNRCGRRLPGFDAYHTAFGELDVTYRQPLTRSFPVPDDAELKKWRNVVFEGNWEAAYGKLARLYLATRKKHLDRRQYLGTFESDSSTADRAQESTVANQPVVAITPMMRGADSQFELALARLGGDRELLRLQMQFFVQGVPSLLETMGSAIAAHDAKALHHNAHRLKGLVATFDDEYAGQIAFELEEMGRTGNLEGAYAKFAVLETVVRELDLLVRDFYCTSEV